MIQYINGKTLRDMIVSGANNLQNNKDLVDKLNVFPVPDGDTGTNMSLTISYAMKELAKVDNDEITNIGKALAKGFNYGDRYLRTLNYVKGVDATKTKTSSTSTIPNTTEVIDSQHKQNYTPNVTDTQRMD